MSDIFPESGYDPDSGEYNSPYDFDPIYTNRVNITSDVYATVETQNPDFTPLAQNIVEALQNAVNEGYFDVDGNRNPLDYKQTDTSFDISDKNVRGPFIDTNSVEKFLNESGLRGIAIPYYDPENDEYWIDVNTS